MSAGPAVRVPLLAPAGDVIVEFKFVRDSAHTPSRVTAIEFRRPPEYDHLTLAAHHVRNLPIATLSAEAQALALANFDAEDDEHHDSPADPRSAEGALGTAALAALAGWREDLRGRGTRPLGDYAALAWATQRLRSAGFRNIPSEIGRLTGASARVTSDRLTKARELGLLRGDALTPRGLIATRHLRGDAPPTSTTTEPGE